MYKERFPNDNVIIADAHQYLLDHYKEYDFIWSSPPCPTHSRLKISDKNRKSFKPVYPDMTLYQEIILLQKWAKGKYCIENVIPYYTPLIKPTIQINRHLLWTNFTVPKLTLPIQHLGRLKQERIALQKLYNIDISHFKHIDKRKCLRNCTNPLIGKHVLQHALNRSYI